MNLEMMMYQYNELKKKYKVNSLVGDNTEIIFVLESPHIDELINKAPVSGLSGKAMSKVVFDEDEKLPLGIKLKSKYESETDNNKVKIGIMNICSIPMQRTAYVNKDVIDLYGEFVSEEYSFFFDVLEKLRTNTKAIYKDEIKNILQGIILDDFKQEIKCLENREIIFIPCGNTAQTFFEIAKVDNSKWTTLLGIPHPSFGNWFKNKYSNEINEIKNLLNV